MTPDTSTTGKGGTHPCPKCGYAMSPLDEKCLRCAIMQADEEAPAAPAPPATTAPPAESAPAATPATGTMAPQGPRPQQRPAAKKTNEPAERPSEVTTVAVLLFLSAILNLAGALTNNSLLNTMPTMFVSPDGGDNYGEAFALAGTLGLTLGLVGLAGKTFAGIALLKMVRWARPAALAIIILLFVVGTGVKWKVTQSFVARTTAIQQQNEAQAMQAMNRALGVGDQPTAGATGTGTGESTGEPTDTGHADPTTTGTEPPGAAATAPGTDAGATEPDAGGEDVTRPAAPMGDPNAMLDNIDKMKPDMREEFKSNISMAFIYISIFGLLFTGALIFMLCQEHVVEAFYEE